MQQCNKTIQKMIKFDDIIKENLKEHNPKRQQISIIHTEY